MRQRKQSREPTMGFGFVVARFGLYLQQIQSGQHNPSAPT